jgi:hypothetical protein
MKLAAFLPAVAMASVLAHAEGGEEPHGRRAAAPEKPEWEIAATGYWNAVRESDSYASGIFAADRGPLHLEARVNYEARHAQSAFAGWTFSGGKEDAISFEATPILGGVGGDVRGPIAGLEATVAAGKFDFYVEAEYVRENREKVSSYTYAWSELGYRPTENLRLGLVGQRTRAYGGEREFQRGGFVQYSIKKVTLGIYWFNPGSSDQVVIGSAGLAF